MFLDILKFLAEVINFVNGKKYRAEQSTRGRYVTYRDAARLQRADRPTLWANLAMGYDKFVYKGNSLISIFSMFQFPSHRFKAFQNEIASVSNVDHSGVYLYRWR